MADQSVAFPFIITHDGWDLNVDREVLKLVWRSGMKSWQKRFARFKNNINNGVYPARLWTLWMVISIVTAIHYSGYRVPYDLITQIMSFFPGSTLKWQLLACVLTATIIWLTAIYMVRYTLKFLFMYKGWLYERRGSNVSVKTKMWMILVHAFSSWNKPKLYSLQGSIPKLPLPTLKDTLAKYLQSVRPLLDDENYQKTKKLTEEFEEGLGKKLQRYLILKSWWSTNYVADWWEEFVYLRSRSPLMINSNVYGMDALRKHATKNQAARAASVIHAFLTFRELVDSQELKPLMIQGYIPLCSAQYDRVFNTTRLPGIEKDSIAHWSESNHIGVYHRGRYFKVIIKKGKLLTPREIQEQLQQIIDNTSEPQPGEEKLAALTAGNRTEWAKIRDQYFAKGVNKQSLDIIEKAVFFVTLDDIPYTTDPNDPRALGIYGKILLHGNGYDRWFDKSFTLCLSNNGKMGVNCEHTWGDGTVMSQIWEFIMLEELGNRFTENGDLVGEIKRAPPLPIRLQWAIESDCVIHIENAAKNAEKLLKDFDLNIYLHEKYGKGFIKSYKVSPDAYIQMALQLAYYRDVGAFCLTYESGTTRLYRDGRTETVRTCTVESCTWVKAMENERIPNEEKNKLLRIACEKHQRNYLDAMCGKGVDRHLFCLYVISRYLDVESPFLQEVLSEKWKLSTSQSPLSQAGLDLKKYPECITAGGGFAPATVDGYGISYIVAGDDAIFFHISSRKSSKVTDCHRFAVNLQKTLSDMKNLCSENWVTHNSK